MSRKFTVPFTEKGFTDFRREYDSLILQRPKFVDELTRARDMGDRSENAAYKSARRTLSAADSRLRFLKKILDNAQIIIPSHVNFIDIGTIVTVVSGGRQFEFTLVGEYEADPVNRKLSYRSPVGQALIRRKVGDSVQVKVPSGLLEYKILNIRISY